jgi:endo-1,4-beta-D-glucanase Y
MAGCSASLPDAWKLAPAGNRPGVRWLATWCAAAAALAGLLGTATAHAAASQCEIWPQWQRFKQLYLSNDGRVIDASTESRITSSEGQSYALTFALIANDPKSFASVLQWTQNNLAHGDLRRSLPAWRWGRSDSGSWSVLDENSAADADLWIAYALLQAGALWHEPSYTVLGQAVADRILREEVALIPGLGTALLPGPKGFVDNQTWRLNPSYVPLQLLRAIGRHSHNELWNRVLDSSRRLVMASAPHGAASDWLDFRVPDGFVADTATHGIGSYDAIRVYLWAGMLSKSDPSFDSLSHRFAPMLALVAQRGTAPETIEPNSLTAHGEGHPGFLAAMLPLLSQIGARETVLRFRTRVDADALRNDQHYYSDVLTLFGIGWMDARYRFDRAGELQPQWSTPCAAR